MIFFVFSIYFLHFIHSIEIYIVPLDSSNPCQPIGSKYCNGDQTTPYDDLQFAFAKALELSSNTSNYTIIFNLMTDGSPFFLTITSTNPSSISPFENFDGTYFLFIYINYLSSLFRSYYYSRNEFFNQRNNSSYNLSRN